MDRLIAPNTVVAAQADTAPASGTPGYATDGNPATSVPATQWPAYQYNAIQEELIAILAAAGITPNRTNNAQVVAAIQTILQRGQSNYAVDSNTGGNNISIALHPPVTAYTDGMVILFEAMGATNTGAVVINAGSGTSIPLIGASGALQGGEIVNGGKYAAIYDSASNSFVLFGQGAGALQVNSATKSEHAAQAGQLGMFGTPGTLPIATTGEIYGFNNSNLLFNGSAEFGNAGWASTAFGAGTDVHDGQTVFTNAAAITTGSSIGDLSSIHIPVTPADDINISGEVYTDGQTQGTALLYLRFFTSAGVQLTDLQTAGVPFGSNWTPVTITGKVPATAGYVVVGKGAFANPQAAVGGIRFRRIKCERDNAPSLYSQEANFAALGVGPNPAPVFVGTAVAANQAAQLGQVSGVVGQTRNLVMNVAAASATATLTADEIVVETALGGLRYCLPSFNHTINLATTGAGGMDTGTAPVSGFVGIYAIYNPTSGASALLATNATSAAISNIYGGTLPTGYTASALLAVIGTTAGSLLIASYTQDRRTTVSPVTAFYSTSSPSGVAIAVSASTVVPKNAKTISLGFAAGALPGATLSQVVISGTLSGIGSQGFQINSTGATNTDQSSVARDIPLITPQTVVYQFNASGATTATYNMGCIDYTI
jgi:hypothetical protein